MTVLAGPAPKGTAPAAPPIPAQVPPPMLTYDEASDVRAAAARAKHLYPGPVGEWLSNELRSWAAFGFRVDNTSMIARVTTQIMNLPRPPGSP